MSDTSSSSFSSTSDLKSSCGVDRVIQLVRDRRQGAPIRGHWIVTQLQPGDYNEIGRQLMQNDPETIGWLQDKLHFDYDPQTWQFIIRRQTSVGATLLGRTLQKIFMQLSEFKRANDSASALAHKIFAACSATILLQDKSTHDPDFQFRYRGVRRSGVVIELADSQQTKKGRKDLARLANQYILGSNGGIQLVIGIELKTNGTKKATISTWCPKYESGNLVSEEVVKAEEFRTEDGTLVTGKALRIQLKHFVPSHLKADPEDLEKDVVIVPYEKLAKYLHQSEAEIQFLLAGLGYQEWLPPGCIVDVPEQTPDEPDTEEEKLKKAEHFVEWKRQVDQGEDWRFLPCYPRVFNPRMY